MKKSHHEQIVRRFFVFQTRFGSQPTPLQLANMVADLAHIPLTASAKRIEEVVNAGYISFKGGRIHLTLAGYALIDERPSARLPTEPI